MKNVVRIGLISFAIIILNGCAEKNNQELTILNLGKKEINFNGDVDIKELKYCPEKKILVDNNFMRKISLRQNLDNTDKKYKEEDVGYAYRIEGCLEKNNEGKDILKVDVELKDYYLK